GSCGGAILSHSANLTLDNCTFDGNLATDGSGGAVWADGGNVTIVGGEFLANTATNYGGAVYAAGCRLAVEGGSRFQGNTAIVGGALFYAEFVSNTAARENQESVDKLSDLDGGGAAMFLFASVNITDSVFRGNYAQQSGGALHAGLDTDVLVNRCRLRNNTSDKYGGAISGSSIILGGGTQLMHNSAADDGGAV
ncbi:unnamed protein product, partial [Laminaria digitata]